MYDVIIAGGGIIGLSTAWKILKKSPGLRLLLLEKEPALAQHQTGRNSGVIHSGIYYPPDSYKAKLCFLGRQELLSFASEENIPYEVCGKVIIATQESELLFLKTLEERSLRNGLKNVKALDEKDIKEIEPEAQGLAGLHVPETGIIDFSAVCKRLAELIHSKGGKIRLNEQVLSIYNRDKVKIIQTRQDSFFTSFFINCGGLHSDRLARLDGLKPEVSIVPFRGEYYTFKPDAPKLIRNLIYPVPNPAFPFLGVHFTRMINGGTECGPNAVLAFGREAYSKWNTNIKDTLETIFNPGFRTLAKKYWRMGLGEFHRSFSKTAFVTALQRLVPSVTEAMLIPRISGIRAQAIHPDGSLENDFLFTKGNNSLHVLNAPSPAATSSLGIGEEIASLWKNLIDS